MLPVPDFTEMLLWHSTVLDVVASPALYEMALNNLYRAWNYLNKPAIADGHSGVSEAASSAVDVLAAGEMGLRRPCGRSAWLAMGRIAAVWCIAVTPHRVRAGEHKGCSVQMAAEDLAGASLLRDKGPGVWLPVRVQLAANGRNVTRKVRGYGHSRLVQRSVAAVV